MSKKYIFRCLKRFVACEVYRHLRWTRDRGCAVRFRPPALSPPLNPAAVPYAVDPHTVERAWFMASRWSALPDVRPGRHGPRLLGSAWGDGVRDGSPQHPPGRTRGRRRRPLDPGAGRSPPEALL